MRRIHAMAALGKTQDLKELLNSGADVNDVDCYGNTPLYYAAYFERQEVLDLLKKRGANFDLKDEEGRTQLGKGLRDALFSVVNAPALKHCMGNVKIIAPIKSIKTKMEALNE